MSRQRSHDHASFLHSATVRKRKFKLSSREELPPIVFLRGKRFRDYSHYCLCALEVRSCWSTMNKDMNVFFQLIPSPVLSIPKYSGKMESETVRAVERVNNLQLIIRKLSCDLSEVSNNLPS